MIKIADLEVLSRKVDGDERTDVKISRRRITAHDRQDKDSAIKCLDPVVLEMFRELVAEDGCLHNSGEGTAAFYEIARYYALIFFSKKLSVESRIQLAGYVCSFL